MAVATGTCPSCGAPLEFSLGASVCKVCEHCQTTVYRTDRGLEDLGKVAAIANVPSLIAVGDEGTLAGRPVQILGRVQLDHGKGPWDEYYVAFDHGAAWGWLAYAEGTWYATTLAPERIATPTFDALDLEQDVALGSAGTFRVAEYKTGRIVSAEGELPGKFPAGFVRRYADLFGAGDGFATIDYGDLTGDVEVFVGKRFDEHTLHVTALGPRSAAKIATATVRCPNCGGDVPVVTGARALRIACRYCGAVSDIAGARIISEQETARGEPPIPLGARGTLDGAEYVCIAYLVRSTVIEGERYTWDELLLFCAGTGFRWLVRDDTGWLFVVPANLAELDLRGAPEAVRFGGQRYDLRNRNVARVDYVLGEVFWKCEVGEAVDVCDYVWSRRVLSREAMPGETRWSYSTPIPWAVVARAFGVSTTRGGSTGTTAPSMMGGLNGIVVVVVIAIVVLVLVQALSSGGGYGGGGYGYGSGPVYGGSGWYYGGK